MKILILINSEDQIIDLKDCKTKSDLFAFMFKIYIKEIKNVDLVINKCVPSLEMKSTFKNPYLNNIPTSDHIIYISDTGLYDANMSFIEYLKTKTTSISTLCSNIKYYTCEDNLFTYDYLPLYPNFYKIKPPLDSSVYAPRKEQNELYILLDKMPEGNITFPENAKVGVISYKKIKIIQPQRETIKFNMYIDYIYEISKANIFIISGKLHDIYLLYELAMCNTIPMLKDRSLPCNLIKKLKLQFYTEQIDWNILKIDYNVKDYLIKHKYTWENAISCIISQLKPIRSLPSNDYSIPPNVGYCLNIKNKNKPVVIEFKEEVNEDNDNKDKTIKKKVILQSQLLNKEIIDDFNPTTI